MDRIGDLLGQMRVAAGRPLRRWRKILAEVEDLAARIAAAEFDLLEHRKLLSRRSVLLLLPDGVYSVVYGSNGHLDEAIAFHRTNGFEVGRPPEH